jgi:hypothetical protein
MNDSTDEAAAPVVERRAYEPPRITWREPYEPVSFGVSCAQQPGVPDCNAGPSTQ